MKVKSLCSLALLVFTASLATAQRTASPGLPCSGGISATAPTNWPQFHFDASHSGCNPSETILGPDTVANLVLAWKYPTGNQVQSSPVVVNGVVYFGSDPNLYAVNGSTGALLWKYTPSNFPYSPAVANGAVYFGSADGYFYALNAATGALIWKDRVSIGFSGFSAPAVVNGVIYFGASTSYMYALNAARARSLELQNGNTITSSPAVAKVGSTSVRGMATCTPKQSLGHWYGYHWSLRRFLAGGG